MKVIFVFLSVLSSAAYSAEYQVPSLRACGEQINTVQSVNGEAFQMGLSLPEAAVETLKSYSSCDNATVAVQDEEIVCHQFRGYIEVCAVPSDEGQFLIVKDSVDGASVHAFPKMGFAELDFYPRENFIVPDTTPCYTELLRLDSEEPGSRDHRNTWIDLKRSYRDPRQASSSAFLELSKNLNLTCRMDYRAEIVPQESCVLLNGIQSCFVPGEAGYLITARAEARRIAVGFYRWD